MRGHLASAAVSGRQVPSDPALPNLSLLLEPEEMTPVLQRSVADARIAGVRVRAVHYRPRKRLVVRYEVDLDGALCEAVGTIAANGKLAALAALPENRALADVSATRAPTATPLAYEPSLDLLVQWLPLDLRLPALAEPTERLRERLRAAGVETGANGGGPALLSYRPRRHAALQLGRHVVKTYATDLALETATAALRFFSAVGEIRAPRLETIVRKPKLTVQSFISGTPQTDPAASAEHAGALLGALHRTTVRGPAVEGLPVAAPPVQLRRVARKAQFLGAIVPELERSLEDLAAALSETAPAIRSLVPSHGDFSVRQLVEADAGGLAVIDPDGACLAPAALDIASYAARCVRGANVDLEPALELVDAVVRGYGTRPPALPWYLAAAVLIRADAPFVRLERDWPRRITEIVGVARSALQA